MCSDSQLYVKIQCDHMLLYFGVVPGRACVSLLAVMNMYESVSKQRGFIIMFTFSRLGSHPLFDSLDPRCLGICLRPAPFWLFDLWRNTLPGGASLLIAMWLKNLSTNLSFVSFCPLPPVRSLTSFPACSPTCHPSCFKTLWPPEGNFHLFSTGMWSAGDLLRCCKRKTSLVSHDWDSWLLYPSSSQLWTGSHLSDRIWEASYHRKRHQQQTASQSVRKHAASSPLSPRGIAGVLVSAFRRSSAGRLQFLWPVVLFIRLDCLGVQP